MRYLDLIRTAPTATNTADEVDRLRARSREIFSTDEWATPAVQAERREINIAIHRLIYSDHPWQCDWCTDKTNRSDRD